MIASNRDEMFERESLPPGRHWPDRPEIIAGLDEKAGGSWFGLNDFGVVAGILNRTNSLGSEIGKRSRGELVLEALSHPDAADAADALLEINENAYRAFNMILADNRDAFWIKHDGKEKVNCQTLPIGISMITAEDLNDSNSPRIAHHLKEIRNAKTPNPKKNDWEAWKKILSDRDYFIKGEPLTATNIETNHGFGTVSSSFLAIPQSLDDKPIWFFCDGAPDLKGFMPVKI